MPQPTFLARARGASGALVLAALSGCAPDDLPPLPEALIVVDTDASVPHLVDRLRVDLYRDDGTWFDSRDIPRRSARDWPASFSVFSEHEDEGAAVVVRLRAYRDGKVRDYRGERFQSRPAPGDPGEVLAPPPPPPGEGPRLDADGVDVTPATEPMPNVTIDRLARLELSPGERGRVSITLRSACFGTMADLAAGTTCVDTENERTAVRTAQADGDMSVPGESGTVNEFGASVACELVPRSATLGADGVSLFDDEVCVPGGAFILGEADLTGLILFDALESSPERVAVIPPLLVDRYEVTVARWRRALAEGLVVPYGPRSNDDDAPITDTAGPWCTYSQEPLVEHSRETLPLNCIGRDDAQAFCRFYGGDLLTEAQWEYIATATGDYGETLYAWGNDPPRCDTHVYARRTLAGMDFCEDVGLGPAPVGTGTGDVSPRGVHDLGGSMAEYVLDSPRPFASRCWASVGLDDPQCRDEGAVDQSVRGTSWGNGRALLSALRPAPIPFTKISPNVGFRCARRALEPTP